MVTVKTKDWGLQFKHLEAHIGNVAAAVKQHEADLKDELSKVAAGGGQHAYARHGWQTGWQAQMVRAVAGKTPDQAFDPYGCNPEIRTWGRVMIADPAGLVIGYYGLGADGRRVVAPVQPTFTPLPDTAAPPKGASAGHFISPMAQHLAMTSSKTKLKAWGVWTRAQRKKGALTAFHGVRRVALTVKGPGPLLGLGFNLPKTATPRSEEEARWLLEAFERRATFKQVMDGCPFSSAQARKSLQIALETLHHGSTLALRSLNPIAFPQLSSFFDALELEVQGSYGVLSVWDRVAPPTGWSLVTAYATGGPTLTEQIELSVDGSSKPDGTLTGMVSDGVKTKTGTVKDGKVILT
ncbi:hypothetical protein [Paraburkholderia sp. EG304]|uniref:hypothetical protein n=1 Tax=Paraburkholderia sp. EG304 TaxID=3237015 RepID=UPI00397B0A17